MCPKCRQPLRMAAENLPIDESLAVLATKHFRDRLDDRDKGIADEDAQYRVWTWCALHGRHDTGCTCGARA